MESTERKTQERYIVVQIETVKTTEANENLGIEEEIEVFWVPARIDLESILDYHAIYAQEQDPSSEGEKPICSSFNKKGYDNGAKINMPFREFDKIVMAYRNRGNYIFPESPKIDTYGIDGVIIE